LSLVHSPSLKSDSNPTGYITLWILLMFSLTNRDVLLLFSCWCDTLELPDAARGSAAPETDGGPMDGFLEPLGRRRARAHQLFSDVSEVAE
jgi:hypothetical protein